MLMCYNIAGIRYFNCVINTSLFNCIIIFLKLRLLLATHSVLLRDVKSLQELTQDNPEMCDTN